MSTAAPAPVVPPAFAPVPVVLEGKVVRLEPLGQQHAEGLLEAAADPGIWRYLPVAPPTTLEEVRALIRAAGAGRYRETSIPFAIVPRKTGRAVGSTRYLDIQPANRGLEIGWTWLAKAHQRTAVNTECKYLLLRHAFESLGALRVCLKTDGRNLQSQRAIERIGAKREGTLRSHMVMWDGFVRDSVYFSVISAEWPKVKANLERALGTGP